MTYLLIGLVFYTLMCVVYRDSFKGANFMAVVRGFIFGVFFWPIAMCFHAYRELKR